LERSVEFTREKSNLARDGNRQVAVITDTANEPSVARDMIEGHGAAAATVAP
jgi:hypothetical protein